MKLGIFANRWNTLEFKYVGKVESIFEAVLDDESKD
jgi:hypothetical protein